MKSNDKRDEGISVAVHGISVAVFK